MVSGVLSGKALREGSSSTTVVMSFFSVDGGDVEGKTGSFPAMQRGMNFTCRKCGRGEKQEARKSGWERVKDLRCA